MIRRLLAGAALAVGLLAPAAAAQAQVTRPIQAFDTPTFRTIFTPRVNVPAQVGDTVQFRLAQPGNVNASTHDVWLQAPGGQPQFLGVSYESPVINRPLNQAGTWSFYCSIHGGPTPGGMNGTILVTETNPGPPVDPGQPWTDPDWEDPDDPGNGTALPNDTQAPTVFEEGDNDAPLLEILKVNPDAENESVRVRWDVSEPGFVTLRLRQGRRNVVATKVVEVAEGEDAATIRLPKRLQDRARRYKLEVWATDAVDIVSAVHVFSVRLGHS